MNKRKYNYRPQIECTEDGDDISLVIYLQDSKRLRIPLTGAFIDRFTEYDPNTGIATYVLDNLSTIELRAKERKLI